MKKLLILLLYITCSANAQLAKYVNPFIGTGGTGHTFPGATTPFAMVQLSPDTRIDGSWEGCSGYHYSDSIIHGFSHTHLSGTGVSDYGDISFMPYFSKTDEFEKLKTENIHPKFSHKNEKASAGFYSVVLDDIPVKVELTATTRTGFQRYTFYEDGYGYIVLNLKHRDELLEGKIEKVQGTKYKGIRVSKAWAVRQELYYGFEVSSFRRFVPEKSASTQQISHSARNDNSILLNPINEFVVKENGNDTKLILQYKVTKGQQILIKTGISTVDADAALNNLFTENPTWNFEKVKLQANNSWEKELRKIEVASPQPSPKERENLVVFYTALYHCMIHPSILNDVDGRYKGRDGKIHKAEGFNYYTVFSLWDTHRALHPLLNIIDKKRSHDFVITFLKQFEQSGRLPMWELWNNETDCMIGFHSVSVILDAYRKQVITKDELQQLWPAVKAEAMSNRFGLDKFREKGFLSVEDESESVSKTLEYSYDMWCVREIAMELNLKEDEKYFGKYENAWQELYNPETGFIQPRKNGNWLQNFNPFEVNNNYTEANAWQYSFYHPQDEQVNQIMLDSLFIVDNKTSGRIQADITGLIGQYAHGNEPSHNYIYLLNNEKRIKYLKYVYDNFYTNKPDGLIGNEDCGQMSAWYVMSALGFYQTCPGNLVYTTGFPLFDSVQMKELKCKIYKYELRKDDNLFLMEPKRLQQGYSNIDYIHNPFKKNSVTILANRKITRLEDEVFKRDRNIFNNAPLIEVYSKFIFKDSISITLTNNEFKQDRINCKLMYSINDYPFLLYTTPIILNQSCKLKAFAIYNDDTSNLSTAHFYKRPHHYSIQLNCKYNKQYTADGDDGIIDGQYGDLDFRKGGWQGYQSQDFEAVIDLKDVKQFAEISANFLQDTRSWILFPTKVEFYISNDNINYKLVETIENKIPANDYNVQSQKLKVKTTNENNIAKYIKIKAYNFGKLPEWHAGKGDDAFIFIDEIEIK